MDWIWALGAFACGMAYGWAWHRTGRVEWKGVKYEPTDWEFVPLHQAVNDGTAKVVGQPRGVLKYKGSGAPKLSRVPVLSSEYDLNALVRGAPFECDNCHGIGHVQRPNFTLRCSACGNQQAHPL